MASGAMDQISDVLFFKIELIVPWVSIVPLSLPFLYHLRETRIFFCSNANMPDYFAAAAQSKSRAPRGFYRAILTERRICEIVKHRIVAFSPRLLQRNLTGKNQFK